MLAEIYLLRLETLMRAEENTRADDSRFVQLNPASFRDGLFAVASIFEAASIDRRKSTEA